MSKSYVRYEVTEPCQSFGLPNASAFGMPIASGFISIIPPEMGDDGSTITVPGTPSEPFEIPQSPSGAGQLLVKLQSRSRVYVTMSRDGIPPVVDIASSDELDPVPCILFKAELLLILSPGAKIRLTPFDQDRG